MESIVFKMRYNVHEVSSFIRRYGGIMTEYDKYFTIYVNPDTPSIKFNNGDTIMYDNGFKIETPLK